MSALLKETQLTRDSNFRDRVEAAMAHTADDVANESVNEPYHDQRMALVRTFYGPIAADRDAYISAMVRRVVRNPTVLSAATGGEAINQAAVPDGDIQFVVNSQWNRVAGVDG